MALSKSSILNYSGGSKAINKHFLHFESQLHWVLLMLNCSIVNILSMFIPLILIVTELLLTLLDIVSLLHVWKQIIIHLGWVNLDCVIGCLSNSSLQSLLVKLSVTQGSRDIEFRLEAVIGLGEVLVVGKGIVWNCQFIVGEKREN